MKKILLMEKRLDEYVDVLWCNNVALGSLALMVVAYSFPHVLDMPNPSKKTRCKTWRLVAGVRVDLTHESCCMIPTRMRHFLAPNSGDCLKQSRCKRYHRIMGLTSGNLMLNPTNDLGYPVGEVARLSTSYGPGVVLPGKIRIRYFMNAQASGVLFWKRSWNDFFGCIMYHLLVLGRFDSTGAGMDVTSFDIMEISIFSYYPSKLVGLPMDWERSQILLAHQSPVV